MLPVSASQSSPALRALFSPFDQPAGLRCRAALDGYMQGVVYTDDPDHPTWAVLWESMFGTLYPAGAVTKAILSALVEERRQQGDTLIGLWPDDPLIASLPDAPQYTGSVIDYTDRPVGEGLEALFATIPEGCTLIPMTAEILRQSPWFEDRLRMHGSTEAILEKEILFALLRGSLLISEASAGPLGKDLMEIGTITHPDFRGRGYATLVSARVIHECEARGFHTYWNCNTSNLPSVALGHRLGYRSAREYRLFGWFPSG